MSIVLFACMCTYNFGKGTHKVSNSGYLLQVATRRREQNRAGKKQRWEKVYSLCAFKNIWNHE